MLKTPAKIIEQSIEAYNRRNIDAFMQLFVEDAALIDLKSGETRMRGSAAIRSAYDELFRSSPNLHAKILTRTIIGNLVADHELVTGRAGGDLEILIIYEVNAFKITKVWVARESIAK